VRWITGRHRWFCGAAAAAIAAVIGMGCTSSGISTTAPTPEATTTDVSSPSVVASPSIVRSPCEGAGAISLDDVPGDFAALTADTRYWVDPDNDPSTPLCAIFMVPADGWHSFLGTYKDREEDGELVERVTATITDVTNLTVDACSEQRALDPPVGPSVDELATALAQLRPFEVASPPEDVTIYGYSGKHVQLRVPLDQPFEPNAGPSGLFKECRDGVLRTWIAPVLSFAYYGYTAPGDTEDFWILDVEGQRLVIAALTSANASPALIAERQSVLDSIIIQP
jgi:hypothetical protein